jgi:hypothetical protein
MEAAPFSVTLVTIDQTARCHTPEDINFHCRFREKIKPRSRLALLTETVDAYCENHTEHTDIEYINIHFVPHRKHITLAQPVNVV